MNLQTLPDITIQTHLPIVHVYFTISEKTVLQFQFTIKLAYKPLFFFSRTFFFSCLINFPFLNFNDHSNCPCIRATSSSIGTCRDIKTCGRDQFISFYYTFSSLKTRDITGIIPPHQFITSNWWDSLIERK